jgi:hypothetical protein
MSDGDDNRLRTLIRDRFGSKAPGQQREEAAGWNEVRGAIGEMLPGENREQFQARMREVLRQHGIEVNGHAGDWVDYSPDDHDLLAGDTKAGNAVQMLVPGVSYVDEDGRRIQLSKPLVRTKADALAAKIGEPMQARGALRGVEEGAAIWPVPYADHIIRRPDGTFTGQLNSAEGMAMLLPRDTGPQGVPIRSLTLHNGYRMPVATAWRHGGVTYVIQHRDNDVSRARAEKVKERLRTFHDALPTEAQRWQRSYAFALDPNPADPIFAQRFGDPNFASSASAGGGQLIIWDAGTHMHLEQGDTVFFDDLRHEVGHNVGRASGAVPSFDSPSRRVSELIRSSDPRGRVGDFVPLPRASTRELYAAVKNWGKFKPPPGVKIMVPNGVTPYGRMSYGENFAEAHSLYLLGIVGYGKLGGSTRSEPIYFRDLFPEWAALFDEMYPDFARQQLKTIADERLPQRRPRVTRQAVRRIQASAVRGSHTPQYHQALPERS